MKRGGGGGGLVVFWDLPAWEEHGASGAAEGHLDLAMGDESSSLGPGTRISSVTSNQHYYDESFSGTARSIKGQTLLFFCVCGESAHLYRRLTCLAPGAADGWIVREFRFLLLKCATLILYGLREVSLYDIEISSLITSLAKPFMEGKKYNHGLGVLLWTDSGLWSDCQRRILIPSTCSAKEER